MLHCEATKPERDTKGHNLSSDPLHEPCKIAASRFGQVTRMRSGRWQARFTVPLGHPSGRRGRTSRAPRTFEPNTYGKESAGDWIRDEERRLNAEGAARATRAEHAQAERARAERQTVVTHATATR